MQPTKRKICLGSSSDLSILAMHPSVPDTEPGGSVYSGDRYGGIWLRPTSWLGTGGFSYPCSEPSN